MAAIDLLVEKVSEHWKQNRVFFLAQVKPFLSKNGSDVEAVLEGRQVRAFIENEVPAVRLIQHEREPTNWGLVPKDAAPAQPYSQYFVSSQRKHRPEVDFPFQNALKIAFTRLIPTGRRRWVFTAPTRFLDLPTSDTPENGIEVPAAAIEENTDDSRAVELIQHWINLNDLDADLYRFAKSSSTAKSRIPRSALHQVIALISTEDLARVVLPLDVIRKLLDKPEDASQ